MIVEVRCVDDDHQRVGLTLALLTAEQDVEGYGLVGTHGLQAVGAWQVHHFNRPAVGQGQPARMAFDRHARIIADLLARAGQSVEQRALSGIGTAGDGDERKRVHRVGITLMAPACLRRIATVMRPTRIAIGSRPNGPRCSGSTMTPSSKPKCLRRQASPSSSDAQSTALTRALVPTCNRSRLIISGWKGAF